MTLVKIVLEIGRDMTGRIAAAADPGACDRREGLQEVDGSRVPGVRQSNGRRADCRQSARDGRESGIVIQSTISTHVSTWDPEGL